MHTRNGGYFNWTVSNACFSVCIFGSHQTKTRMTVVLLIFTLFAGEFDGTLSDHASAASFAVCRNTRNINFILHIPGHGATLSNTTAAADIHSHQQQHIGNEEPQQQNTSKIRTY